MPLPKPSQRLLDSIATNQAIAVVGSGLSSAAGVASWPTLLRGLCEAAMRIRPDRRKDIAWTLHAIDRGSYLDAASMLRRVLGPEFTSELKCQLGLQRSLCPCAAAIAAALRGEGNEPLIDVEACDVPLHPRPTLSHRILVQLGFRAIITTNFDDLLERACPSGHPLPSYSWSYAGIAEAMHGGAFILKLHGDVAHPSDIIFTREDYRGEQFVSRARKLSGALLATHRPLWIGYGHNDPDLDLLLDEGRATIGISGGFAIESSHDPGLRLRLEHAGISLIPLDSHAEVPRYLQQLAVALDRPVSFSVVLDLPWTNEADAKRLGQALAAALQPFGLDPELWTTFPGSVTLHFELPAGEYTRLVGLLVCHDPTLLQVLRLHHVREVDGVAVDPSHATTATTTTSPTGVRPARTLPATQADGSTPKHAGESAGNVAPSVSVLAATPDRVRILLVCANPRGTVPLRLGAEERALREALQLATHRDMFVVEVLHAATLDDLRRALLRARYDIVHFSGHATSNGLQFEDAAGNMIEPASAALGELLQRRGVKTVVLNACGSLGVALAGTASLEHTIAMKGPIEDESAVEFSRGFYDALGEGLAVSDAFEEGVSCCKLKKLPIEAALLPRGAPPVESSGPQWTSGGLSGQDLDLLRAWRSGKAYPGTLLFQRYAPKLTRYFQRNVYDTTAIPDMIQDTFLRCHRGTNDDIESTEAYLFGIAHSIFLRYLRQRRGLPNIADIADEQFQNEAANDNEPDPEYLHRMKEEHRLMVQALRRIPLKYHAFLELSLWENITNVEIGRIFGLSTPAVARRRILALKALAEQLRRLVTNVEAFEKTKVTVGEWQKDIRAWLDANAPGALPDDDDSEAIER